MNTFTIKIDGKDFEYIASKKINGVDYIVYADELNVYVAKYTIKDNNITLEEVSEEELSLVKGVLNLE